MKILAIGAHFDDVELSCGGSLTAWKDQGHSITIFVATCSGYSDSAGSVVRSDYDASTEGKAAAKLIGAELIEAGFPTFEIEFGERLNSKIIEALYEVRPDLVLTHWSNDIHHDHRAVALASLHCCRHVPRLLMYCSNWYESDRRFDPRFFVDISNTFDRKTKLIEIYQSENIRTKGVWLAHAKSAARLMGLKASVQFAEGFEVVKWLF
jgi:LmbE family N-acetylglucosaminyl deacetylase